MKSFSKIAVEFFSRRSSSFLITLVCIAAKSLLIFFYTYTGKDKIYSLSASYNLLHGKGWTNSFYHVDNINQEVLEPFCYWPPGYGMFFTPFQTIFRENIFLGTAVLEIMCFVAFILLCRGILSTQKLPIAWINLSTILLSFYSHDFIEASLGTDLIALVFLLGFFYCSLLIWNGREKGKISWLGVAAGLCLFLAGFTRYMYVPVGLLIAVLLPIACYWKKNRIAMPGFLIAMLTGVLGLVSAMIIQDAACGSPFYTGIKEQGIFWNNLSFWHPAAIASFTDLNFMPVQLSKISGISFLTWLQVFNWINWGIYLWILAVILRYFIKHRHTGADAFPLFEWLGSVLSVAIIGELALLSLINGLKYTVYNETWTFITEGRYHAFPVVFFQLFLLKNFAGTKQLQKPSGLYQFIFMTCFALLILNSLHQVYFTAKVGLNYRVMKQNSTREQDYVFFEDLLKKTRRENPGKDILVASDDKYYPLLASMLDGKGIADIGALNKQVPVVYKPAILYFIIYRGNESRYAGYLRQHEVNLVKEVAGTKFFVQLLKPGVVK